MDKKSPPPGEPGPSAPAAAGTEERSGRHRRRFGEGETTIMRLDELLRARPAGGGQGGEKTQVVSLGDLQLQMAHQTERTIAGGNLSPSQVALLQRTEPKASAAPVRTQGTDASVWAPRPEATQAGVSAAVPPPAPVPPSAPRRPAAQLEADEGAAPGVATRIGPPPAGLRPLGSRGPRQAEGAAGQRAPAPIPWQGATQSRATSALGADPPRTGPADPRGVNAVPPAAPVPDAVARPTEPQDGWPESAGAAAPPAERAPGPPTLPPRTLGREAKTDPGLLLPGAAAAAAPARPPSSERPSRASAPPRGKRRVVNQVVVVFSCKGGAGATALAANAAHAAATNGQAACILDLDLQLGDALAAFGLQPKFSVAQAIGLLAERQSLTRNLLASHASGVHVLSQVGNLNDLERITPESMGTLLLALRQQFDAIFVDGVRDFGDNALAMLDSADKVVIVCVQEVLAIRRARWIFGILRKIGFEATDISLVVNRYNEGSDIPLASIRAMFEGAQVLPLGGDGVLVTQALNRGVPLAELRADHPLVDGMARISSHLLCDDPYAAESVETDAPPEGAPQNFLRRMFKGKGGKATP